MAKGRSKTLAGGAALTDKNVGRQIFTRRKILKMSQGALALELGLTFQQVQKYENGSNRVSASRLWELSKILRVPVSFFFEGLEHVEQYAGGMKEGESARYLLDFADTREGGALIQAFGQIKERSLRRALVDLAEKCAKG
jgi:transcriptional regulator with XRE-family HTH domain